MAAKVVNVEVALGAMAHPVIAGHFCQSEVQGEAIRTSFIWTRSAERNLSGSLEDCPFEHTSPDAVLEEERSIPKTCQKKSYGGQKSIKQVKRAKSSPVET